MSSRIKLGSDAVPLLAGAFKIGNRKIDIFSGNCFLDDCIPNIIVVEYPHRKFIYNNYN